MDSRITTIVENFDYDRVQRTMVALNWAWVSSKTEDKVPTTGELVIASIQLMTQILEYEGQVYTIGTGGFYASIDDDLLSLSFEVDSFNCDKKLQSY